MALNYSYRIFLVQHTKQCAKTCFLCICAVIYWLAHPVYTTNICYIDRNGIKTLHAIAHLVFIKQLGDSAIWCYDIVVSRINPTFTEEFLS